MSLSYSDISSISQSHVKEQLEKTGQFACLIPFTNRDTDLFFSGVISSLLELTNHETMHSGLEYAINELTANSSKANLKRLYFGEKGINHQDNSQYDSAMETFKRDVFEDFAPYEEKLKDSGAFVSVRFFIEGSHFGMEVGNGTPILEREMARIRERLVMARKFENLTEVLTHGFDDSEGAGFGLIIILLMLRKVNLDEKILNFENVGSGSKTTLRIPKNLLTTDQSSVLAEVISNEIKQMPQFPTNITNLQRELSNPNCSFESIAESVNTDPALSAEILRIANSPVYKVRNTINDVTMAVRIIGMLGVKSVLYNYGMNQIMKKRFNDKIVDEVSEHSFIIALIGSYLARYKKITKIAEDVYIAGLLHDMGKIIVNALSPELEKKLEKICSERHIPIAVLEDLSEGYNHALIGAEVAEKWDFPPKLIQPIKYHHIPLETGDEFQAITYCVYLANEIVYYEAGNRDFHDLNYLVLQFFGFEQLDTFEHFLGELKTEGLLM